MDPVFLFDARRTSEFRVEMLGIHVQFRLDVFARKALFRVNRFFPPFNRERERESSFRLIKSQRSTEF